MHVVEPYTRGGVTDKPTTPVKPLFTAQVEALLTGPIGARSRFPIP
jgi:hypothetical protein